MASKCGWLIGIGAYLLWFVVAALGFWLALQLRTSIEITMIGLYARDDLSRARVAGFVDKIAFSMLICAWVVGIVMAEGYFRGGVKSHLLMKRFAMIFGPGLLVLFLVDLFNLLILGIRSASWWQWLLLAGELLIGVMITRYGYKALTAAPAGAPRVSP